MADAIHSTTTTKHQKLITEKNQEDPNKFYYHFLYKATLVAIFFVILPLFPSQAPEFINQSLVTRNWELLHILFVGIAISYGLFSRRHDETDKENGSKFDNAQTLVSRFLQVSSFFEDEAETPSELSDEGTKVQTWNNQHYRDEPVVVVAPQAQHHSSFDNKGGASGGSRMGEKPLLLPVRSLKSRLCDDPHDDHVVVQTVNEQNTTSSLSLNRSSSKTGSKRFSPSNSMKARNAELEGPGSPRVVEKVKDNVVLPSPIPWRSRSGRLEPKQEVETPNPYASNSKPSMEESEFNKLESRSVRSQTSRSSRTSNISPSPKLNPSPRELSPSPSFASESLAKNAEDVVRKKVFYKSCPPPPPPPPPMFQKSISMKPIRCGSFNEGGSFDKDLKRSFTGEGNMSIGGKWGRSFGAEKNLASFSRVKDVGEAGMNEIIERSQLEDEEEHFMEELIRKTNMGGKGYENMSFRSDKFMGHASVPLVSKPASMEFVQEEEKESFLDKVIVETDDEDSETEDEDVVGRIMQKDSVETPPVVEGSKTDIGPSSGSFGDEGPDVDKKADEFIAKFREQIRLQRIESIKKSTRSTRNSSR